MRIPALTDILPFLKDESTTVNYLIHMKIFPQKYECLLCANKMYIKTILTYKCGTCKRTLTLSRGTIFYNLTLGLENAFLMFYQWLCEVSFKSTVIMSGCSTRTVTKARKRIEVRLLRDFVDEQCMIGGEGIEVQIDESKFGKVKYHRGHKVDGVWVFGGVEKTPQRKMFAFVVLKRDKDTLFRLIKANILPGSIIICDGWKSYDWIKDDENYENYVVNHTVEFVTADGKNTNTIEGTWNGLKMKTPSRCRTKTKIIPKIIEFIWRRRHAETLWISFLKLLK